MQLKSPYIPVPTVMGQFCYEFIQTELYVVCGAEESSSPLSLAEKCKCILFRNANIGWWVASFSFYNVKILK